MMYSSARPLNEGATWVGNPRAVVSVILLTIVALVIYGLMGQYKTFDENEALQREGIGGAVGLSSPSL